MSGVDDQIDGLRREIGGQALRPAEAADPNFAGDLDRLARAPGQGDDREAGLADQPARRARRPRRCRRESAAFWVQTGLRPRISPLRPNRMTSTVTRPSSCASATARARSAIRSARGRPGFQCQLQHPGGGLGPSCLREEALVGAELGETGGEILDVDPAAARVEVEGALGELAELAEAAGERQPLDRMGRAGTSRCRRRSRPGR